MNMMNLYLIKRFHEDDFLDYDEFAGFDITDKRGADNVESTGLRRQNPRLADLTEDQGAHA